MTEIPAGWYPDPVGRHEHRYWDGSSWTEHAATAGRGLIDPLDGSAPHVETTSEPKTNEKAVIALVLGLAQVALPVVATVGAIILGVMARTEIRQSQGRQRGTGFAVTGIVLGSLGMLFAIATFVVFVWYMLSQGGSPDAAGAGVAL